MANNSKEEPKTAPQADRWYNLTLGPSFKDDSSNKYCTLRYEFKPASIDKTKPGSMKKTKENRVNVEFQNNQVGKPKVLFEGSSEDYKESDAVLFFDGHTFRLERLHRAVKQLRHLRQPGESVAAVEHPRLSPPPPPSAPPSKVLKTNHLARTSLPVEVERFDIGSGSENPAGSRSGNKATPDFPTEQPAVLAAQVSPDKDDEVDEHRDIDIEDIFGTTSSPEDKPNEPGFDMNVAQEHNETDDDEIADVDDSGDEVDKGPNAAEALRAQVNAEEDNNNNNNKGEEEEDHSSTSSSSSGTATSASSSASASSSSDSKATDEDSVNSI